MEANQWILDDYHRSDGERRLSLFLTHRDLRQEFMQIEMALKNGQEPLGDESGIQTGAAALSLDNRQDSRQARGSGESAQASAPLSSLSAAGPEAFYSRLIRKLKACCPLIATR